MNLSVIFSKLKPLFPVAVVASSIVITVKLLTSETPSTSEILKVEAKEDIYSTNFKDDLVIPEEPPEEIPPEKEPEPPEPTKEEEKQDTKPEDASAEENKQSDSESEDKSKKKDEEKDQQKPKARKFNPNNPLSSMLSKILGNKDK